MKTHQRRGDQLQRVVADGIREKERGHDGDDECREHRHRAGQGRQASAEQQQHTDQCTEQNVGGQSGEGGIQGQPETDTEHGVAQYGHPWPETRGCCPDRSEAVESVVGIQGAPAGVVDQPLDRCGLVETDRNRRDGVEVGAASAGDPWLAGAGHTGFGHTGFGHTGFGRTSTRTGTALVA
jgi:hypothetical protein